MPALKTPKFALLLEPLTPFQHLTPQQKNQKAPNSRTKPHAPTKWDLLLMPVKLDPFVQAQQAQNGPTFAMRRKEMGTLIMKRVRRGELNVRAWDDKFYGRKGGWGRVCYGMGSWKGIRDGFGEKENGDTRKEEEINWIKHGKWEYGRVREIDGDGNAIVDLGESGRGVGRAEEGLIEVLVILAVVLWLLWTQIKTRRKVLVEELEFEIL